MRLVACLPLCLMMGCTAPRTRAWLLNEVDARTGFTLGSGVDGGIAPKVVLDDGLGADEAVALALWQSPVLHAELTQLATALATFDEAHRPANPRLNNFLFPLDVRQLALVLFIPLESLWQLPSRISAATAELESTAESLVQLVLDTERTVRQSHADAVLAERRIDVLLRGAQTWREALELAQARAASGDIAEADVDQLRVELTWADDAVQRAEHESVMARARLTTWVGSTLPGLASSPLTDGELAPAETLASLQTRSLARRPDLTAAAFAVNAAAARADWERTKVFSLFLSVDGQAPVGGLTQHFAPGFQAELPLFSQNQGGIGRADAAVSRAAQRYLATRLTVLQDVAVAHAMVERAQHSVLAARRVSQWLEHSVQMSGHAFERGAESYTVVVDAVRRTIDASLRELELEAELRRAEADLIRSVGGRESTP